MKIKPFLRWAGGKQNIVDEMLINVPEATVINTYIEPFIGAGSLYFSSEFSNAIISDINPQLVNSYNSIKLDYLKVHNLLQKYGQEFKKNPDFYYKLRHSFNLNKNTFNYIQAARFIFLIHSNYNGMYRVNKSGNYNVPVGKLNPSLPSLLQLEAVYKKMSNTTIQCSDYKLVMKSVGSGDFVYLDPPYPPFDWANPQNQYTINGFKKEDHEMLAEVANKLRNRSDCFLLISYPDTSFVRDLYKGWDIVTLDTVRSISGRKERKKVSEVLIKNY